MLILLDSCQQMEPNLDTKVDKSVNGVFTDHTDIIDFYKYKRLNGTSS